MKTSRVNIKVILDKRRETVNGKYPLKIRVTYKRERKYYATGNMLSDSDWVYMNSTEVKGKLRSLRNELAQLEVAAFEAASKLIPFTFKDFEDTFFERPDDTDPQTVLEDRYNHHIQQLRDNGQIKTAKSYSNSLRSLKLFKPKVVLADISVDFLQDYENWMLAQKKSITTVGIYLRCLRTVMNLLKSEGKIEESLYPFGRRKYSIPKGKNTKKALAIGEIKDIFEYRIPKHENTYYERRSKDFWIFSYLANGMNFNDIAKLRWEDFGEASFTFYRSKTKRTNKSDPRPITVLLNNHLNKIIKEWGNKENKKKRQGLVFDIIDILDSPLEVVGKIDQHIKVTNRWMKCIGEKLGISIPITTYVARHSFATISITNGNAPIEFVSQSLGHASIMTTQNYFAGFNTRRQAEFNRALLNF